MQKDNSRKKRRKNHAKETVRRIGGEATMPRKDGEEGMKSGHSENQKGNKTLIYK
jgi:hypothetical protein